MLSRAWLAEILLSVLSVRRSFSLFPYPTALDIQLQLLFQMLFLTLENKIHTKNVAETIYYYFMYTDCCMVYHANLIKESQV